MPRISAPSTVVFLHSYDSTEQNWHNVVFGCRESPGRLRTALAIGRELDAQVIADDRFDAVNHRLYRRLGIENIKSARTTADEVRNFLSHAPKTTRKIFVTSPDHLPRVARNALALGAENAAFIASSTPYTPTGAAGVVVRDRPGLAEECYGPDALSPADGDLR